MPRCAVTSHHHHADADADADPFDWDHRGEELEREAELDLGWIEQVLEWLAAAPGVVEHAVDLGSGPGVAASALATAFPGATVTAVDGSRALLDRALARAERVGLGGRVRALQHDLTESLSAIPWADVLWISRVLHHLPDPAGALAELHDRLRPGGRIVVVEGGLPARWAPEDLGVGRPDLQARLDVAMGEALHSLAEHQAIRPGTDWAGLLRAAGFSDVVTRSWLDDVPAPAPDAVRARVRDRLVMAKDRLGEYLGSDDLAVVARLVDPADPLGVARRPDLFWLSAQTVHTGRA